MATTRPRSGRSSQRCGRHKTFIDRIGTPRRERVTPASLPLLRFCTPRYDFVANAARRAKASIAPPKAAAGFPSVAFWGWGPRLVTTPHVLRCSPQHAQFVAARQAQGRGGAPKSSCKPLRLCTPKACNLKPAAAAETNDLAASSRTTIYQRGSQKRSASPKA